MLVKEKIVKMDGHDLLLRNARDEDAEMLLKYLKVISGETRFLLKEPDEITLTLEEECKFIHHQNESDTNLMPMGFSNAIDIEIAF